MEGKKIIYETTCKKGEKTFEYKYGYPINEDGKLVMDVLKTGTITLGKIANGTVETIMVSEINKEYPDALVISKKNFEHSMNIDDVPQWRNKIIYDYTLNENDKGIATYVYGYPKVKDGKVSFDEILDKGVVSQDDCAYIRTMGFFEKEQVVDFRELKYFIIEKIRKKYGNNIIIISKKDYEFCVTKTPIKETSRFWKRVFRADKLHRLINRLFFPERNKCEFEKRWNLNPLSNF